MAKDWQDALSQSGGRVAGPAGAQQQSGATATGSWQDSLQGAGGVLGQGGRVSSVTGGQVGSLLNGWNTPFHAEMIRQRDQEAQRGTLNDWSKRRDYTGVATHDEGVDSNGRKVNFGDVYERGQFKGNVLDPASGYGERDGYQILAQLMPISDEAERKAYESALDNPNAVKQLVENSRQSANKQIQGWRSQQEFQGKVEKQKDEWDDPTTSAAIFAAGFGGGAAIGATGFVATPLVGAITTIGGGLIGGVSALLNQDQIEDQAARATVQTGMAADQFGPGGAASTALRSWGGVASSALSPVTNLVQGATDAAVGEVGDERSEYYTMDNRPIALTALNLGAGFVDAIGQFANPIGQAAYLGTMGATTLGGVGQLTLQGGATFDDRTGRFDAPDDALQWGAAIGAVGIDALQMGSGRAIARAGELVGARGADLGLVKGAKDDVVETAGRVFKVDRATGEVKDVRTSITFLAPSEAVQWMSVRAEALRTAAQGRALTADDLYQAAMRLQNGATPVRQALVNGFGEGTEEAIQTILEPASHGWSATLPEIFESYLSGAVAGAGMTVGARLGRTDQDTRDYDRAKSLSEFSGNTFMSRDEWNGLDEFQKKQQLVASPLEDAVLTKAAEREVAFQKLEVVKSEVALQRRADAINAVQAAEMKSLNPVSDRNMLITLHSSANIPSRAVQASLNTTLENLRAHGDGLRDAAAEAQTPEAQAEYTAVAEANRALLTRLTPLVAQVKEATDATVRERLIEQVNQVLHAAWNSPDRNISRAATLLFSRDPQDNRESLQALMPQVSVALTEYGQGGGVGADGVLQIGAGILKGTTADFDGDEFRRRSRLVLDESAWASARSGRNHLGVGGEVTIPARDFEADTIQMVAIAAADKNHYDHVTAAAFLDRATRELKAGLAGFPNVDRLVDQWSEDVLSDVRDASNRLMVKLAQNPDALAKVAERADGSIIDPFLEIVDQTVNRALQEFREQSAWRAPSVNLQTPVAVAKTAPTFRSVAARAAATPGQTVMVQHEGVEPLRAFQALHYSDYRSAVVDAGLSADSNDTTIRQLMVAWYEQLSGNMRMSALQQVLAKDEVTREAYKMLVELAAAYSPNVKPQSLGAFTVQGLRVPNIDRDGNDRGGFITIGQLALRDAAEKFAQRDAALLDALPDLKKKYDGYRNADAYTAFAEVFEPFRMVDLLGERANNMKQMTVGQTLKWYGNMDPEHRQLAAEEWKQDTAYDRAVHHDLPYSLQDVASGAVSEYQIVVDSILGVGNKLLSMERSSGKVHGRLAEQDDALILTLETSLERMRQGIEQWRKLYATGSKGRGRPKKESLESFTQSVMTVLDRNADAGRALFASLPDDVANVVIQPRSDGSVALPNWFFEMLHSSSREEQAMIYLRETFLAQARARQAEVNPKPSSDRLVQLFEELQDDPTGAYRKDFMTLLLTSKSVKEWREAVNRRFVFDRAPMLAFYRDSGTFDPADTTGGWQLTAPGALQRQALRDLSTRSVSFMSEAAMTDGNLKVDGKLVRQMLANPKDARWTQLRKILDQASSLSTGIGPAEMKRAAFAAGYGFSGGLTDKGKSGESFAPFGANTARGDQRTWGHGPKKVLDAFLSGGVRDVSRNPQSLNRAHRLYDEEGRKIEWSQPDAETFLQLWLDPAVQPMLRGIVFPSVWSNPSGAASGLTQQFLTGQSLKDLLENRTYLDAFQNPDDKSVMVFASLVDGLSAKYGESYPLYRLAQDLVVARTSAAYRQSITAERMEEVVNEAFHDVVAVARAVADTNPLNLEAEFSKILLEMQERNPMNPAERELLSAVQKTVVEAFDAEVADLEASGADPVAIAAAQDRATKATDLFNQNDDAVLEAIRHYTYDPADPTADAKANLFYDELMTRPDLHAVARGKDGELVRQILANVRENPGTGRPLMSVSKAEDQKYWAALGRALAQSHIDELTMARIAGVPSSAVPAGKTASRLKYLDPTYKYLIEPFIRPGGSPLLSALREFRTIVLNDAAYGHVPDDVATTVQQRFFREYSLGKWTPYLALEHIDGQNRIDSSGAADQIAGAGIAYEEEAALSAATARTDIEPSGKNLVTRVYQISSDILTSDKQLLEAGNIVDAEGRLDNLLTLNGRFISRAVLHSETGDVDLFTQALQPGYHSPAADATRRSSILATDVNALRRAAAAVAPADGKFTLEVELLHPDDLPEGPQWANNVFYEGVALENAGDDYPSLNAAAYFAPGGINQTEQRAALDAVKSLLMAVRQPEVPTTAHVVGLENVLDMAGTLRAKVSEIMRTNTGHGVISPDLAPAIAKAVKTHHFVRAVLNDMPVLLTAEEVIRHQAAKPGTLPEGLEQAELVVLPTTNLRTLIGDTGSRKTLGNITRSADIEFAEALSWTGKIPIEQVQAMQPGLLERNEDGTWKGGDITTTTVANRSYQSQLSTTPALTGKFRSLFTQQMLQRGDRTSSIYQARAKDGAAAVKSFTERHFEMLKGDQNVRARHPEITPREMGLNIDLPTVKENAGRAILEAQAYSQLDSVLRFDSFRALWLYDHSNSHAGNRFSGVIHGVDNLKDGRPRDGAAYNIAPDDAVMIDVAVFAQAQDPSVELRKVLNAISDLGSAIVFINTSRRDLLVDAHKALTGEFGYAAVPGANTVFVPDNRSSQWQTVEAHISKLGETRRIGSRNYVAVVQTNDLPGVWENANIIDTAADNVGREVLVARDLVPVSSYGWFGVSSTYDQAAETLTRMEAILDDNVAIAHLATLSGEKPEAIEELLRYAIEHYDVGTGLPAVGSTLRPGDLIPLVDHRGRMLFYRHGFKPLDSSAQLEEQLATTFVNENPDLPQGAGLAIYGSEPLATATSHEMTIYEWQPTNGYGLSVVGGIPLSEIGNKSVHERSGMKGVGHAWEGIGRDRVKTELIPGWRPREFQNLSADSVSKEDNPGVIDTAQDAIAYLGFDFNEALSRTLHSISESDWAALSPERQEQYRSQTISILRAVGRSEVHSLAIVNDLIQQDPQDVLASSQVMLSRILGNTGLFEGAAPAADAATALSGVLTPEQEITRAALFYMMTPNAQTEHIMSASGFGGTSETELNESILMPRIFTQIFDNAAYDSPLRNYFFERLNRQFANQQAPAGETQQGYTLLQDWTFVMQTPDGKAPITGRLQFAEAHSTGDNVVMNQQAFDRRGREGASFQYSKVAEQAFGVSARQAKQLERTDRFASREGIEDVKDVRDIYALMNGPAREPRAGVGQRPTRLLTLADREYKRVARIGLDAFRQPLDLSEWDKKEVDEFTARRASLLSRYNLSPGYTGMVDGWIRQWLGSPKDRDPQTKAAEGRVYFKAAQDALAQIELNMKNGLLPTHDSAVPMLHRHDLWALFQASRNGGWQPLRDDAGNRAETWEQFVDVSLGSASSTVESWLIIPLDGFMHTYMDTDESLLTMPISMQQIKQLELLDESTNAMMLSLDPGTRTLLEQQPILDAAAATYEHLFGGQVHEGRYQGNYPPSSAMARRVKRVSKWKSDRDMQEQIRQSLGDVRARGFHYRNEGTVTNGVMRVLVNIRAAQGMANPLLMVSAPVESFFRSTLQGATDLITGQGIGKWSQYTDEQRQLINDTIASLSGSQAFKGMIGTELHQHPKLSNAGAIERVTAHWARVMGRAQDPSYGMRQKTMARHYVMGLLNYYSSTSDNTMTVERLMSELRNNPLAFRQEAPRSHQLAMNRLANIRSVKPTTMSMMWHATVDAASSNPHFFINVPSNLAFKIPFLFQNFAFNFATNILGLQGMDNALAVLFSGNKGGKSWGRLQAKLAGERFSPEEHGIDLLGETMESINFADQFIKGGLTHTSLMGVGLLLGGLGLGGEDDEDRRLRRAGALENAAWIDDPRDMANDFRNKDTIYLDSIPILSEWFRATGPDANGDTRSPAVMNWTVKQFMSPFLGITNFLDTGDFKQVMWGFEDALLAMPLVNTMSWDDANRLANELYGASIDSEARGTPEDLANASNFLLNAVMKYERMLLENSFVNSIYVGMDKYDRDPWVLPEVDGDGALVRDDLSQPMETGAMEQIIDANGNISQAYVGRNWDDAMIRQLGENRATLAFFGSLFTGTLNTQNSLVRYDQTVKQRKIEKAELSSPDAAALVLSMWDPNNNQETLTREGGAAVMRGLMMATVKPGDPALQNVYLSFEQRKEIQAQLLAEIMQEGIDLGLSHDQASDRADQYLYGSKTNPYAIPLWEVIWSKGRFENAIPYSPTVTYNQLNTTYVMGPSGRPMATGVERSQLLNFFGQSPLKRYDMGSGGLGVDERLNSTDAAANINTGLRSLERVGDNWANPTDDDILQAVQDGFKSVVDAIKAPSGNDDLYGRNSFGGGYGRGGYGGGGGGGGGSYPYRVNGFERNDTTYARQIYNLQVDNPILRRATIRRERFSSERGRLKPWQ